jgi:protein SCO1
MTPVRTLAIVGLLLAFGGCTPAPEFRTTDISAVDWGGDVTLQAHTGKQVSMADFRGKLVLLYFGYTHCPDICAPTLTKLAAVRKALGTEASRVQVLFITVDPARDTAGQLATFVPSFDPSFIGLTGTPADIARTAGEYRIPYVAPAAGTHDHGQHAPHSGNVLVKDAGGKLRLLFRNETSVADMVHDLKRLLDRG